MNTNMEQFINQFPVHKTIKFKLFPIGKTYELMKDLLYKDKERAMAYQVVKCLINDYCQNEVIAPNLKKLANDKSWLNKLRDFHDASNMEERNQIQNDLAGIVNKKLPKTFKSKALLGALPQYMEKLSNEDLQRILHEIRDYGIAVDGQKLQDAWDNGLKDFTISCHDQFQGFSGFLKPLEANLKFLFSGRRNGIAHRIVYQNLVTFYRNERLLQIIEDFGDADDIVFHNYSDCLIQKGVNNYNERIGQLVQWLKEYGDTHSKFKNWHKYFKKLNKQILSPRVAPEWLPKAFNSDGEMVISLRAFIDEIEQQHSRLRQLIADIDFYDDHIYFFRKALSRFSVSLRNDCKAFDDELRLPRGQAKCKSVSFAWMPYKQELIEELNKQIADILSDIDSNHRSAVPYLNLERAEKNDYRQNNVASLHIHKLMEAYLSLYRIIKPFTGTGKEEDRSEGFYDELTTIWDGLQHVQKLYDAVRNWLNTKVYENNTYPVYLNKDTILNNWTDKATYIKRNGKYYFIIYKDSKEKDIVEHKGNSAILYHINKQDPKRIAQNLTKQFVFSMKENTDKGREEPTQAKFVRDNPDKFLADWKLVKTEEYKDPKNRKAQIHAISYFQRCLQAHPDYNIFNWQFRSAEEYETFDSFVDSLKDKLYKIEEKAIDWSYVKQLAEEGKVYLFKLYNKDYAENKMADSNPNLHTLYWEAMFSRQNLSQYDIKLEEPKLFRREEASIRQGELDKRYIPRRFLKDQLELHIPLHMNANAHASCDINQTVLGAIREGTIEHIIGIDRGERNLLYYSVLRLSDGEIIDKGQGSLNVTFNDVDYHALLSKKEEELHDEQKNWKARTSIRKLKEGYLSQAIHQLTSLVLKYHAVIVLEDLPENFRQKIDKQIYQIFERKLMDKLSYLVDKSAKEGQPGSLHSALQLANPEFKKDENIICQNGILFLVPPEYTSAIDPITGFCNLFDRGLVRDVASLLCEFEGISYNQQHDWFEFTWDYAHFVNYTRLTHCETSLHWTVCSNGSRIEWTGSEKMRTRKCEKVDLTDSLKALFDKNGIQYQTGEDIREAICSIRDRDYKKELKRLFFLMLSLRNTIKDGDKQQDYIISPTRDGDGTFYDSRDYEEKDYPKMPICGDANGAYNIARKGILSIKKLECGNEGVLSLYEWADSARQRNIHL